MAPEIFTRRRYNLKADVYSWSMVSYEVLALQKPYAGFTRRDHVELVCGLGGRPKLAALEWPGDDEDGSGEWCNTVLRHKVETLLHQTWAHDPSRRLSMDEVYLRVNDIWNEMEQRRQGPQEIAEASADVEKEDTCSETAATSSTTSSEPSTPARVSSR